MAQVESYRGLSGPHKAAVLVMAIGEEHAARIFEFMDHEEVRDLSQYMAQLGSVSADIVERLSVEFADQISGSGALVGNYESTERLLKRVMDPSHVDNIMEDIRGPAGRTMWDKLGNVNEQVLANYLKNEYPQTVAVVLSKINSEHAARVLAQMPESFAMEVVMRMLRMQNVQDEVLEDIERTLYNEFMANLSRSRGKDPYEMVAEIFNSLETNTENRFLSALEDRDYDSAERIKNLMFTFEDLASVDAGAVQTVLQKVEKDRLALALKGASERLRNLFFSNMSERAAKIMREDMQAMGPVRLRDVDEAQTYIVQTAKDLAAEGEILISTGKDEEIIY